MTDTADDGGDRDDADHDDADSDGDTFGVGIHVTESEFQFVVHVPSDIDSGWTDPETFQRHVERAVWERLDRDATLRELDQRADAGETVTLGRITLIPDGTVLDTTFSEAVVEAET
jgi:hypothetical protein